MASVRLQGDGRPLLTRSPVYVLTLVAGAMATGLGWAVATLFERTISAVVVDVDEIQAVLPHWLEDAAASVASLGAIIAAVSVHVWLIGRRQFRRLALVEGSLLAGAALSWLFGTLVLAVQRPDVRALFEDIGGAATRSLPTSPTVAAVVAALVMVRQWIPVKIRTEVYIALLVWIVAHLVMGDAPPYLGLLLDVGLGMIGGSAVALAFRTPNLQPDRPAILAGLADAGVTLVSLHAADVDARGSEPWLGETPKGELVFVKALSSDQRAADLLFRALRWIRLRRTGDAPPEVSLKRAAEHEAMVAHHVHDLGVATPQVLAVADVGPGKVALAYEGIAGRSLDAVAPDELTDDVLRELWTIVADLRRRRIAHRDLRLANAFLADDGRLLLIDFGFAELAAPQHVLDTDVAELLAGTATVVGSRRAVEAAVSVLGVSAIDRARDWLHPLAFTTATREAVSRGGLLEELRGEVNRATGHTVGEYEPLARLSSSRLLAMLLVGVGLYSVLVVLVDDDVTPEPSDINWNLVAVALLAGLAVPWLVAAGYRSALGPQLTIRSSVRAALASEAPVAAPTWWSFANRLLSDSARDQGVRVRTAKRAAATWTLTGLACAPPLVAGFTAAGNRTVHGELGGIGRGLGLGALLAVIEALLLRFGPSGRELVRVWINPYIDRTTVEYAFSMTTLGWCVATRLVQGMAFALAARAVGVETQLETLVAVGIFALTVASLLPAPGGIGAVELLTYAGLVVSTPGSLAVVAAVTARVVLFWSHLPGAVAAYLGSGLHRARVGREREADRARRLGSFGPSRPRTARGSWWT